MSTIGAWEPSAPQAPPLPWPWLQQAATVTAAATTTAYHPVRGAEIVGLGGGLSKGCVALFGVTGLVGLFTVRFVVAVLSARRKASP